MLVIDWIISIDSVFHHQFGVFMLIQYVDLSE